MNAGVFSPPSRATTRPRSGTSTRSPSAGPCPAWARATRPWGNSRGVYRSATFYGCRHLPAREPQSA